jgi:DNA polymerase-3 subunit gamma/tau
MGYIALYRKFRPARFDEMVGQEHIVQTLKNQIINNRIGHAFLLSGGRGSGKTTTAKILARAVNCLSPINGEPCNECEICKEALAGSLTDIKEMDAASNNGVDNIRDIREEVEFMPTKAKYRVYIIDEVHMLSTGAFNALLKTLEEPPLHVIFILATTEPQKLPATILSRCQRFDFKRISPSNIIKRLKYICDESNIKIEDGALRVISALSEGAMRDAISILERCITDGDTVITETKIKELAGVPEFEYLADMLESILESKPENVLKKADGIINIGKSINVFLWELIKLTRDALIYKTCGDIDMYNQNEKEKLFKIISEVDKEKLINLITGLSEVEANIKWSNEQEILFEAGLLKLCTREVAHSANVEKQKEDKKQEKEIKPEHNSETKIQSNIQPQKEEKKEEIITEKIVINQTQNKFDLKDDVIQKLKDKGKVMIASHFANIKMQEAEDLTIILFFNKVSNSFSKSVLEKEDNKKIIKEVLKEITGKEYNIKFVETETRQETKNESIPKIDFPINIIE